MAWFTRVRYQSTAGLGVSVPFHQFTSAKADAFLPQSARPTCGWCGGDVWGGGVIGFGVCSRRVGMCVRYQSTATRPT